MKTLLPLIAIAALFSCNKHHENPNEVNASDRNFIFQAYLSNRAEIKAGQSGLAKSTNAGVINFSRSLIDQYSAAQQDLVEVAKALKYSWGDTSFISVQNFSEYSGHAFDTAFMKSRVRAHMSSLNNFQSELNSGNNPYLRYYYLNKYIDKVRSFFATADSISRTL